MTQDRVAARETFAKACNAGAIGGCMNTGILARTGDGGAVDMAMARKYFGYACKLGNQDGCNEAKAIPQQ